MAEALEQVVTKPLEKKHNTIQWSVDDVKELQSN
jgi:hypothetical protein